MSRSSLVRKKYTSPLRLMSVCQGAEGQTLISRNGDVYFFLTNAINREIKNVELSSSIEAKLLGELIFDDVLKGQRKHKPHGFLSEPAL